MTRQRARPLPPAAGRIRERIDEWRRTRLRRTRMPEDLWEAATELARDHGAWATARALGVRYDTLSFRLRTSGPPATSMPGFVELPPPPPPLAPPPRLPPPEQPTVIEITRADGTRLTIRQASAIELQPLVAAFCRAQG